MTVDKEHYHNKGQQDAAEGHERNLPNGGFRVFAATEKIKKAWDEEDEAYNKGFDNVKEQEESRVICTHFFRKGMLPQNVWRADMKFTAENLSKTTVRGYHFWAIPYVKLMRKSPLAECLIFPASKWRAEELAYQMGVLPQGNFKGKIVRLVAEPLCWLLGCFFEKKDWNVLNNTTGKP